MSADNFGIVHRHGDGYGVSMFFASNDDMELDLSRPYYTSPSLEKVVGEACNEYFEYGWSYDSVLQDWLIQQVERK